MSSGDIFEKLNENPKRVRGDQGEVEQRSADDIIKLDQYAKTQATNRWDELRSSIGQGSKYGDCGT